MNPHDKYAAELQKEQSQWLSYDDRVKCTRLIAILGLLIVLGACI